MSGECQVNVKSQSELDIGGRETCYSSNALCKNFYLDPISSKVSKDWEN